MLLVRVNSTLAFFKPYPAPSQSYFAPKLEQNFRHFFFTLPTNIFPPSPALRSKKQTYDLQEITLQVGKAKQMKLSFHNRTTIVPHNDPVIERNFYYNDIENTGEIGSRGYYRLRVSNDTKVIELLPFDNN
jgi:hypothetical protein